MKCLIYLVGLFALAAGHFDLDALEEELRLEPFVEINPDVSLGRRNLLKNACSCNEQNVCSCCAAPNVFGLQLRGCVTLSYDVNEKSIYITVKVLNSTLVDTSFPTSQFEHVCGQLPQPASMLNYCINTQPTETPDGGLLFCTTVEVLLGQTPAAEVSLSCLRLKDGKLSFDDVGGQRLGPVSIRVKNPLKVAVDAIRSYGIRLTG